MPDYVVTLRLDFRAQGESEAYRTLGNLHSIANLQRLLPGMDDLKITRIVLKKRGRKRPLCSSRER
jgi:hypothetical protein